MHFLLIWKLGVTERNLENLREIERKIFHLLLTHAPSRKLVQKRSNWDSLWIETRMGRWQSRQRLNLPGTVPIHKSLPKITKQRCISASVKSHPRPWKVCWFLFLIWQASFGRYTRYSYSPTCFYKIKFSNFYLKIRITELQNYR